jgi:hypothetical protein
VLKCTDVEPGETVRFGTEPNEVSPQELIVYEVSESRISFTDGSYVQEVELPQGQYWHKFKQSPW